jgi:hypothetical protein
MSANRLSISSSPRTLPPRVQLLLRRKHRARQVTVFPTWRARSWAGCSEVSCMFALSGSVPGSIPENPMVAPADAARTSAQNR